MAVVAQVCRVGAPHEGGMERVVAGLARALQVRGHQVEVFTLDEGPDGRPLSEGRFEDVQYRRLGRRGPRRYPFARGLTRAVRGFDLVHVHGLDGLADTLVSARPAPVGISTHGGYFHTSRNRWIKEIALRTWTRRTLQRADAVWYTSEADRARLAAASVVGEVVANGVEVGRYAGIERRPEPGRWLVFGRVDVHKGLADVLAVLARVDAHVDVVGPEAHPGLLDALRAEAHRLGVSDRVQFWGHQEDAGPWIARAELALFPSRYEGFGVALVELMGAGLVPVVSPIPAFDAIVTPGIHGFLLDWSDPIGASRVLRRLRGADLTAAGSAAAERARDFGWERRVLAFERAYERVLSCASA